jgi:hypothetical protein
MTLLNKSNESTPSAPVTGSGGYIPPTAARVARFERNYLKTNITGQVKFTLHVKIEKRTNGCTASPGPTTSKEFDYIIDAKDYSNNLNSTVEGGNIGFYLTKPSYMVKPRFPPNTLPYLSYSFFSTRFVSKHLVLMNLVDNVMGPPQDAFWLLNATYRVNFTILENSYFGYQFIRTNIFLRNMVNPNDIDTSKYLKGGTIPINYSSSIGWDFPYKHEFRPIALLPNKLPYTPYPGVDTMWCIDSDYMVHFYIKCRDTANNSLTFGKWTSHEHELTAIGACETLDAVSVSGAPIPTNASIFPCG